MIDFNKAYLGIELGSTRIKAALIDDTYSPVAGGSFDWENEFAGGYWTYPIEKIHKGVQECFKSLKDDVLEKYSVKLVSVGAIGISAMMHGYLAFDKNDDLLVPFRTWRNTTTEKAAAELTKLFDFNIPQRWSISHLYQAILNNEPHIPEIAHITTLAGYIHFLLTGKRELGIGDASGMFPIANNNYDGEMLDKFRSLTKEYPWDIEKILPEVKLAGDSGACLTEDGAKFLDPTGELKTGIPVCPPEGDAGTGMVATNAVLPRTGNVSAGTSVFSMLVMEKPLEKLYPEIDIVTTPDGSPVAMVHCNNCCSELDVWVNMFGEFAKLSGNPVDKSELYTMLYNNALNGDSKGIVSYNFLSGEPVAGAESGRPMYFRLPESKMTLANFMKSQLYSSLAALTLGMKLLFENENVTADKFVAHGGLFKVKGVAQQILADALKTSVSVMKTAGEGGAWGMALLAAYMINGNKPLPKWLDDVFSDMEINTLNPDNAGMTEFENYLELYEKGLASERKAGEVK